MYGDALWGLQNLLAARNTYQEVVRLDLSEALTEAASLRLVSVEDPAAQAFLRPFFIEQSPDSARLKLLENFPQQHSNPVIHLLKARLQFNKRDYDGVLQSLERAKELPDRSLCFLREKLSGESNFSLRRFEQARVQFWQALNYTTNEASRLRLNEWIDRCEWMAQQGKM
jgi:predicted negative regulator of RcsB-dependent stress response